MPAILRKLDLLKLYSYNSNLKWITEELLIQLEVEIHVITLGNRVYYYLLDAMSGNICRSDN